MIVRKCDYCLEEIPTERAVYSVNITIPAYPEAQAFTPMDFCSYCKARIDDPKLVFKRGMSVSK